MEPEPDQLNVSCSICAPLTVDYTSSIEDAFSGKGLDTSMAIWREYDLPFRFTDSLPNLPKLHTSFEHSCQLCGELRAVLRGHHRPKPPRLVDASSKYSQMIQIKATLLFKKHGMLESESLAPRPLMLRFRSEFVPGDSDLDPSNFSTTSTQIQYDLYTQEDNSAAQMYRVLPSRTALSPENSSLIRHWVRECKGTHLNCCNKAASSLPTRVLDVSAINPVLVAATGINAEYAALSHCWGISENNTCDMQCTTTSKSLSSRLKCIPLEKMPRTFQDAVAVTRVLGLQYLWIDSLCILQDSEADMKEEIRRMASVYGNATVTIAATSAVSSASGFLGRDPLAEPVATMPFHPSKCDTPPGSYSLYSQDTPRTWDRDVEDSKWNRRAWTFQERIISTRVLHFAKNKLYFECCSTDKDEDGSPARRPVYDRSFAGDTPLMSRFLGIFEYFLQQEIPDRALAYSTYYYLAEAYSRRELTFHNDREAAFSAIVTKFHPLLNSENIHGMWLHDMHHGLLWRGREQDRGIASEKTNRHHESVHSTSPSWSWYSFQGGISWPERARFGNLELTTAPLLPNKYVRYLQATGNEPPKLQIQAHVREGFHEYIPDQSRGKIYVKNEYVCYPQFDTKQSAQTSGKVWVIRLPSPVLERYTYRDVLVVEPAYLPGYFKRIGCANINLLMPTSVDGSWIKLQDDDDFEWVTLV